MIYYINNEICLFKEEILDEITIYKGKVKRNSYCIFSDVQPNRNFEYDPYIKVYNNADKNRADEVLRISMKDGRAIYHRNSREDAGKDDMIYTKELAQFLTDAMDKPHCAKIPDKSIITVYDAIYYYIEDRLGSNYNKYPVPNFMEAYKK